MSEVLSLMNSRDVSRNFSVAKVLAIFIVVAGHYFPDNILWLPVTVGLFIFAFSSGFFTSTKYSYGYSNFDFWWAKLSRLGIGLCVINLFLFLLFLYQDRSGLFSWQTLPNLFGLGGFLTWFQIPNDSPYGAGLWFFTLLLLFYVFYPVLEYFNRKRGIASAYVFFSLGALSFLHYAIPMGHALWLTIFGFIFGAYSGRNKLSIPPIYWVVLMVGAMTVMLFLNITWKVNSYNYFLLIIWCCSTVYLLLELRMPEILGKLTLPFNGLLLEVYLIHTYLFVKISNQHWVVNFLLTIGLVFVAAFILSQVRDRVSLLLHSCRLSPSK
ncbi:MAG: hypothetical protein OEY59_13400 [Deltaproteobacteria bacterium]|nr:hypothetical protein [Deltaproteobacteria bacterium]